MITQEEKKKLPANDAIIRMGQSINQNDLVSFYKVLDEYAEGFRLENSTRHSIKNILRHRPMQMQRLNELSSNVKKLIIQSDGSDENVFLDNETRALIDELLLEWANVPSFRYHNLRVRSRILLHGETGNGKTTIAKYIAKKVDLPFLEVKAEEVIDSHLGSTAANIFAIFNQIKQPCVLFWDEVDSIGCKRGTDSKNAAGHENDRMTNSILVNLDKLSEDVIFIAATNRNEVLDSAFVRRFDVKWEISPPTLEDKERFLNQLLAYYNLPIEPPDLSSSKSYSDIKHAVVSLARSYVVATLKHQKEG